MSVEAGIYFVTINGDNGFKLSLINQKRRKLRFFGSLSKEVRMLQD